MAGHHGIYRPVWFENIALAQTVNSTGFPPTSPSVQAPVSSTSFGSDDVVFYFLPSKVRCNCYFPHRNSYGRYREDGAKLLVIQAV